MVHDIILTALALCSLSSTVFALHIDDEAPLFSLRDGNGNFFHLNTSVGAKKQEEAIGVIINFFSSACNTCRKELLIIGSLVDELAAKSITVVIIGYNEDFDKISDTLAVIKVDKPIVLSDPYGKGGNTYGIYSLPLTVFIQSDGKVRDTVRGEVKDMRNVLRQKAVSLANQEVGLI